MNQTSRLPLIIAFFLLTSGAVLAGCGQRQQAGPTPTPAATVTPLSAAFKQPTTIIKADSEKAATTPTPTTGVDLARGEKLYTDKGCAECHGAQGEGVQDKGSALAGAGLSAEDFETILRTGGQGSLGSDHLYGTQSISPSGMEALYAFINALPTP